MLYIPEKNESFSEEKLHEKYGVANSGGIRPSNDNKVIILINSQLPKTKGGYNDKIDETDGTIIFTGHGETDQTLTKFNKSLEYSKQKGYTLLYFERSNTNELVFRHKAEYIDYEIKSEKNLEGIERRAIKFKLKIID